jgi:hypothetical protein
MKRIESGSAGDTGSHQVFDLQVSSHRHVENRSARDVSYEAQLPAHA